MHGMGSHYNKEDSSSHSMVLDISMSYFATPAYPQTNARKVRKTSGDISKLRSDWYGNHSSYISSRCGSSDSISLRNDHDAREPNGWYDERK